MKTVRDRRDFCAIYFRTLTFSSNSASDIEATARGRGLELVLVLEEVSFVVVDVEDVVFSPPDAEGWTLSSSKV